MKRPSFRFARRQRSRSPDLAVLLAPCRQVDADVIERARREARARQIRLAVIDEGDDLATTYGNPKRDLLYDSDHGNWDFFADHTTDIELALAAEALVGTATSDLAPVNAAACLLFGLLATFERGGGRGLHDVGRGIRALRYEDVAGDMRALDRGSPYAPYVEAVLDQLHEHAGRFAAPDTATPPVSVERWFSGDPASILFVTAHAPVSLPHGGACRSVHAMLRAIEARATALCGPPHDCGDGLTLFTANTRP